MRTATATAAALCALLLSSCAATGAGELDFPRSVENHPVSTHCGVTGTVIDGDVWLADPPLGDHNPPAGWDDEIERGQFTITDPESAVFTASNGDVASFVRAAPGTPDPSRDCE